MSINKCPYHNNGDSEMLSQKEVESNIQEISNKAKLHITNAKRSELLSEISNIFIQKLGNIDLKQTLSDIGSDGINLDEYPNFSDLIFTLVMKEIYQNVDGFKEISQDLEDYFPELSSQELGIPIERIFLSLLMQAFLDVIILQLVSQKYQLDNTTINSIIAKNMRFGSTSDNNNIYNTIEDTLIIENELARDMCEIPENIRTAELKKQMLENIENLNQNTSKQASCPFFLVEGQKKWIQDFAGVIHKNFTMPLLENKEVLDYYFGKGNIV